MYLVVHPFSKAKAGVPTQSKMKERESKKRGTRWSVIMGLWHAKSFSSLFQGHVSHISVIVCPARLKGRWPWKNQPWLVMRFGTHMFCLHRHVAFDIKSRPWQGVKVGLGSQWLILKASAGSSYGLWRANSYGVVWEAEIGAKNAVALVSNTSRQTRQKRKLYCHGRCTKTSNSCP